MADHRQPEQDQNEWMESPTAWFAVLERARFAGNYDLAARAQRELDRLGVRVRFVRPERRQEPQEAAT